MRDQCWDNWWSCERKDGRPAILQQHDKGADVRE